MLFWERSALPLATEGTQECIWNLSYNERRMAIELELTTYLEEEDADALINQFVCLVHQQNPKLHKNLQFSNTKQQKSHKKG